jgi:CHASE3 domain sensor protein
MESYYYESGEYPRMEFSYSILETDEEMQKRIDTEKANVEWRRKQFEQLQKEFGG